MNGLRVALATVGVAVAVAGLAMVADPALAGTVPSSEQAISVLGVLALVQAGRVLWLRYRSERRAGIVENPPETPPAGPSPGADFDDLAAAAGTASSGRTVRSRRNRLRRRLRRAVVAGLARREDLDRAAAVDAIEDGTWTDDPDAAALFTDEVSVDGSSRWLSLSGSDALAHRANRAAVAVADMVGVEGTDGERTPGDGDRTPGDGDRTPDDDDLDAPPDESGDAGRAASDRMAEGSR